MAVPLISGPWSFLGEVEGGRDGRKDTPDQAPARGGEGGIPPDQASSWSRECGTGTRGIPSIVFLPLPLLPQLESCPSATLPSLSSLPDTG